MRNNPLITGDWSSVSAEDRYANNYRKNYGMNQVKRANNEPVETGFFDAIKRGSISGGASVPGGQADFLNIFTGIGGDFGDYMQEVAQDNQRKKEYELGDYVPFASDYYTNPEGLTYDASNAAGSMAALAAEAAALYYGAGLIVPSAARGAMAVGARSIAKKIATKAAEHGMPWVGKVMNSPSGKLLALQLASTPLEAASEAGNTAREVKGKGGSAEEQKSAAAQDFAVNSAILTFTNALQVGGLGKLIDDFGGKDKFMTVMKGIAGGAVENAYEEGAQQSASEYAQDKNGSLVDVFNPYGWSEEAKNAAAVGGITGGLLGGVGVAGGNKLNNVYQNRENLQQATNEEPYDEGVMDDLLEKKNDKATKQNIPEQNLQGYDSIPDNQLLLLGEGQGDGGVNQYGKGSFNGGLFRKPSEISHQMQGRVNEQLFTQQNDTKPLGFQQTIDALNDSFALPKITNENIKAKGFAKKNHYLNANQKKIQQNIPQQQQYSLNEENTSLVRTATGPKSMGRAGNMFLASQPIANKFDMKNAFEPKQQESVTDVNRAADRLMAEQYINQAFDQRQPFMPQGYGSTTRQEQGQLLANLLNARAASEWDKAAGLTREQRRSNMPFVPQRASLYNGALRRNLERLDRIKPDELPSVSNETTDVNRRAAEIQRLREQVIPQSRENAKKFVAPALLEERGKAKARSISLQARSRVREDAILADERKAKKHAKERYEAVKNDVIGFIVPYKTIKEQLKGVNFLRKSVVEQLHEQLEPIYSELVKGMGHGVTDEWVEKGTYIPTDVGDLIGHPEAGKNSHTADHLRYSNNAPWYQQWFKRYGRKPRKAEIYQVAEDILTNRGDSWAWPDKMYDGSPEANQYLAEVREDIDMKHDYINACDVVKQELKNGKLFTEADYKQVDLPQEVQNAQTEKTAESKGNDENSVLERNPQEQADYQGENKNGEAEELDKAKSRFEKLKENFRNSLMKLEEAQKEIDKIFDGLLANSPFVKSLKEQADKEIVKMDKEKRNLAREEKVKLLQKATAEALYKDDDLVTAAKTATRKSEFYQEYNQAFFEKINKLSDIGVIISNPIAQRPYMLEFYENVTGTKWDKSQNHKLNEQAEVSAEKAESKPAKKSAASVINDYKHTTKKTMIKAAKLDKDFSDDEFKEAKKLAEENGGFYSKYASQKSRTKGIFLFEKGGAEGRDAFVAALNEKFGDKQEASVEPALERGITRDVDAEQNNKARERIAAENKNESQENKGYRTSNRDWGTTVNVKNNEVTISFNKSFGNMPPIKFTVAEYQKAAVSSVNRLSGIRKFLMPKVDAHNQEWIDAAPNENVRLAREDDVAMHGKDLADVLQKLVDTAMEKAGIEAADHNTLFNRAKTKNVESKEDVQKAEVERVAKEVSKEPSLGMYARKGDQADFVRHYMNVAEDTISELGEDEPLSIDSVSTKELEKMFAPHMVKLYDEIRAKDRSVEKVTESAKQKQVKADFGDSETATNELAAALGIKRKQKAESKPAPKKKAFDIVDDSDEALAKAIKEAKAELNKLSANPVFNPALHKAAFKVGAILIQRGANNFVEWSAKMLEMLGEKIRPWLGSVWKSIEAYPKNEKFDDEKATAATRYVGAKYNEGYTTVEDIYNAFAMDFDPENLEAYKGLIDSAFAGIDELYNPTLDTADTKNVVQSKQEENSEGGKGNADNNRGLQAVSSRQQTDNVQETGSGEQIGGVPEQEVRGSEGLQGRDVRPAERTRPSDRGGLSGESETQQQTVSTSGRTDKRNVAEQGLTPAQQSNAKAEEVPGHNFIIKSSSDVADNGAKTKFKGNIAAITLLKKLEAEGRMATPSEQRVLAKYIGWGPLQEAFNGKRYPDWESEAEELKNLLTPKEWNAARDSVLTAFYTPPEVIKSIYGIIQRLGFKGGRVLDPAMGSGNFFGAMPEALRKKCMLRGVEIETISGGMAKQLYQDASVEVIGYENAYLDNEGYDLVITNVPFKTDIHPVDADFKAWNFNLHNYFFAKSVQKVRPGGLICFITSENTMKSNGKDIRKYLADKVDFIGAIKLPDNTFKSYAGTTVTSDLIILQKRGEDGKPSKYAKEWLRSDTRYLKDAEGKTLYGDINEYYVNNPEMVIGQWARGNYGSVIASGKGLNVSEEIDKLVEAFPKNIYKPVKVKRKNDDTNASTVNYLASTNLQDGSIVVDADGETMVKSGSSIVPFGNKSKRSYKKDVKCANSYASVRDVAKKLLEKQLNPEVTDEELQGLRNILNKEYDNFVAEHGPLRANSKLLSSDPDYGLVCSIENYSYNKKTKETTSSKTAIFTQRTVNAIKPATSAANESEALLLSLSTKGRLDLEYMQELLGGNKSKEDIIAALGDKIFKDPVSADYVMADEYLSDNVREKLEHARMAAQTDKSYAKNIKALEKVIPQNLTEMDIHASLGSAWIPAQDIEAFANELMETDKIKVDFVLSTGTWTVYTGYADNNIKGTQIYGTKERSFGEILSAALNQKSITVTHDKEVDAKATDLANAMVKKVQDAFEQWIWKDEKRRERLVNFYNNNFNATVLREYDGSMLTVPGYSAIAPELRKHQKDAIWRIVQNGTCLLAHCVGAGKTWVMQASAMEQKRLGLINKPMFTIPNHMVEQFTNEFRQIYPNAKLLVLTTENLPEIGGGNSKNPAVVKANKAQRKATLARIATEDWDGIIISHELFKRIPMSQKAYEEFYQEQIDELENALNEAQYAEGERSLTVKELVSKLKKAKEKMENLMKVESKDLDTPFDKLGIDQIYVDEADLFKNLAYVTNMTRVSGLSNSNSQRSQDMYIKTQYLLNTHNGRGVVFATGTPISNTIAEMFTMLRYLNPKALKEHGVSFFDTFINTFSKKETTIESKPEGNGYRQVEKFVRFYNMGGLKRMFREVADVKTQADLDIKIPELKNGKRTVTEVPGSKELNQYITNEIKKRAEDIHNGAVQPDEDNMLKLTSDMRKATLDMRLLDKYKNLPLEVAAPKLKAVADNVYKKYQESSENKGTQLIFCDLATPKGTSDKELSETANEEVESKDEQQAGVNAYSSIGKELIKMGIPAKKIAFIHDAKNDEQKEALFAKVRNGEVRVLIGSTSKMGAGTNIQKRVVAEHHVDCPWRPRDIEQREGRALRQGNINDEVEIFTYITKGSLDEFMWEKIKNKASMIEQAMNADLSINTVEDISAEVLSYAEIQGLASGDPFIPKRVTVAAELNSITNQYREYRDNITRNKNSIAIDRELIADNEKYIKVVEADVKETHSVLGDDFSINIDGKTYAKFSEAEEYILDIVENGDRAGMHKGSFGGLNFTMRYQHKGFPYRANYFNNVDYTREARNGGWVAEFDSKAGDKCYISAGGLRAMSNLISKSLNNFIAERKAQNKELEKEIAEAKKALELPFDKEDKLKELQEEQQRIDKHFATIEVAAKIGDKYSNGSAFKTNSGEEYHSLGNTKIEDTDETSTALLEAVNDKTGATEFIRVDDIASGDDAKYSIAPQKAYHGSNRVFNNFRLEHSKEGHGDLTHGYGVYFAADEKVANSYRKELAGMNAGMEFTINGDNYRYDGEDNVFRGTSGNEISINAKTPEGLLANAFYMTEDADDAVEYLKEQQQKASEKLKPMYQKALELAREGNLVVNPGGATYESLIPSVEEMIDEDATYSEQPEVVKRGIDRAFNELGAQKQLDEVKRKDLYGNNIYVKLMQAIMGDNSRVDETMYFIDENEDVARQASELLDKHGVKGLRYDGEVDGEAFVVFNEKAIEIKRRYEANLERAAQRTREEVLNEVKKALPTAKISYDSKGNLIAEMPNGRKVGVVVEDRILLNQQQAKSAGKAHNTIANEAEGYWNAWEKLNGSDVLGVIHVSRNSRVGTAFHEVLHAAMDLSLTSKEKEALYKHFKKVAEKSGRDIEEEIADGYKEWVLKRQQGQGSLFGKLYKKAIDFLNKLYTMFVNANNVGNIFRKIESGKVYDEKYSGVLYEQKAMKSIRASIAQAISSAETSIKQIPAIFKKIPWEGGTVNIDIGGGKFDLATDFVKEKGVENIVFDPFNRDYDHNSKAFEKIKQGGDTVTVANVLNVIAEENARDNVILQAARALKPNGTAYFGIYEGSKDGVGKVTSKGWQNNKKAGDYISEVEKHFNNVRKAGNIIIATEPNLTADEKAVWSMDDTWQNTVKYSIAPAKNKLASTFTNTERKNIIETFKDWFAEQRKDFYVKWFDKNDRLHDFDKAIEMGVGKKVDESKKVYSRVQTLPATSAGMATALIEGNAEHIKVINDRLKHKKLKHNATMQMVLNVINKSKMDKLHPSWLKENGFDSWINALGAYLGSARLLEMSKRAKEEGVEYKFPNGLTSEELMNYIAKAPAEFKRAADLYYKFNDNMLTIMEDAGLISEETHRVLNEKYKHYCPLMRDFSDTAAADAFIGGLSNGGRGIANVSNPLKRISIEGSERNVFNPLESTVNAVSVICNRAERNKVGQMAVELAQEAGLENVVVEVEGDKADEKNCIFTVMFNGKKQAYQTSQELYGPIVGYNLPAAGLMLGIARSAAHLLRTGATMSPSFILRNLIRDTIFAGISSKNGFVPILDTIRGAQALLNDPKMKAEFETAGITSFNFYNTAEEIAKSLDEMADNKNWREYTPSDIWKAIINHPTKPFFMTSEFVESATRMGEYLKAREKGLSIEEAARAARELTLDFSRSGVSGEKYNQVVPFFNACLQGGDKLRRLFKEDFLGTLWNVTKYIILPSFVLWMLNHDEDWYKEIDPSIKNTNWILPGGIRIPKPQEAGVIFGSGIEAMLDIASGKDKEAMDNWSKEMLSNMAPNIIPTVFLPIIEWQANYSFFRGQNIANRRLQQLPDELQYTNSTSEVSKAIGKAAGLSPVKIDNTIRGYTGTMGMFLAQAPDRLVADKRNLPEKKISELTFLRDFNVTDMNLNRSVDEFYDMLADANKQHAGYGKKGKPSKVVKSIRNAGKMISDLNKDIQTITNSRLSPSVKRARIDKKRAEIKRIANIAVTKYGKYFD